jgi:hypothetical protein
VGFARDRLGACLDIASKQGGAATEQEAANVVTNQSGTSKFQRRPLENPTTKTLQIQNQTLTTPDHPTPTPALTFI